MSYRPAKCFLLSNETKKKKGSLIQRLTLTVYAINNISSMYIVIDFHLDPFLHPLVNRPLVFIVEFKIFKMAFFFQVRWSLKEFH